MNQTNYLDKRDFTAGEEPQPQPKMLTTGDPSLDELIQQYSTQVSTQFDPRYLQALVTMGTLMARSDLPKHNYDIMVRTVYEMFEANKLFAPYRHVRKIAVFGSARIKRGEPAYHTALEFSRESIDHGYMIITGGGPGIMQASNEGAGAERSFGLNIKLPYEQHSNHVVKNSGKLINFHYFFVRKLNFVSQSDAMVAFPGGFGTMDEVFETLTLIQTGKAAIYPIVLLDSPGKSFWQHWATFVRVELLNAGLIDEDDMSFIHITKSPRDAIEHIDHFYKIFHSYRFLDQKLVIRLNEPISEEWLQQIESTFSDLIAEGGMILGPALPEEADEPLISNLPRIIFNCNRSSYGRLRQLIDMINDYQGEE